MDPARTRRKGFTLLELILVIAILAVMIALLVPAIQRIRAASARTQCEENLRHLGVAFFAYHDLHKVLPTGGRNAPGLDPDTGLSYTKALLRDDYSWCFQILPHLEPKGSLPTEDAVLLSDPRSVFLCPTRRKVQLYHGDVVSDYAGNGGTNSHDGVLLETGRGKPLTLRAILDGAANTLLLGERRVNIALLTGRTDTQDNESCLNPGYDGNVIRWANRDCEDIGLACDLTDGSLDPATPHNYFGSSHPNSMNALLADGSVRTMAYDISAELFRRICVREDVRMANFD